MTVYKQFELELEVKLLKYPTNWGPIFRSGRIEMSEDGSRNPRILFYQSHLLRFTSAVNGDKEYYVNLNNVFPLNKWTQLKASQLLSPEGEYIYRVYVDGVEKHSVVNNRPLEIGNADIQLESYGDVDGDGNTDASLRNMRFATHDCPATYSFDGQKCIGKSLF